MKDLDPIVFLAVFQEMLGFLLWVLVLLIVGGMLAFAVLLIREKGLASSRLVRSQLAGVLGGLLALVLMVEVSSSGYTDAGGPVDWLLIALVFGAGLIGSTILVYTVAGWWSLARSRKKLA